MKTSNQKPQIFQVVPVLTLSFLALAIPEILMGSTPFSRANEWLIEFFFYASGVLLIREIVVKLRLGWLAVIFIGLAYGVLEEGLILHSIFNPRFLNLDLTYGRVLGVNWVWAEIMVVYHAVFSISLPIFFSQLIFRRHKNQPWLTKPLFWIVALIFVLSCAAFFFIFYNMSGYLASPVHYLLAVLLIVFFVLLAFKVQIPELEIKHSSSIPSNLLLGLVALVGSGLWLVLLRPIFIPGFAYPAWGIELAGVAMIGIFSVTLFKWGKISLTPLKRLYVLTAMLISAMIHGLEIIYASGNKSDLWFEIGLILLAFLLIFILGKSLKKDTT